MRDLVVALDDADGRILYAGFFAQEGTLSTFEALAWVLRRTVRRPRAAARGSSALARCGARQDSRQQQIQFLDSHALRALPGPGPSVSQRHPALPAWIRKR